MKDDLANEECIICFDELHDKYQLKCKHHFHLNCMITYLLTKYQESSYSISGYSVINRFNFNCPICRQKINKDKIMHMLNIYEENLIKHKQNITKETAQSSMKTSIYSNEKIRKQLNFEFIPIKDSVKDAVVYFNQLTD